MALSTGLLFLFVLSSTAFAAAPICFDRQQVGDAAERLGMGVGWTGVETNLSPVESAMVSPTKTLILFLKDGGGIWSLWRLEGEEGCLLGKGTDWQRTSSWASAVTERALRGGGEPEC